jgi:hypothetical protein
MGGDIRKIRGVAVEIAGFHEPPEMAGIVGEKQGGVVDLRGGNPPGPVRMGPVKMRRGREHPGGLLGPFSRAIFRAPRVVKNEHD